MASIGAGGGGTPGWRRRAGLGGEERSAAGLGTGRCSMAAIEVEGGRAGGGRPAGWRSRAEGGRHTGVEEPRRGWEARRRTSARLRSGCRDGEGDDGMVRK
jgi:hypothetical protein